MAVFKRDTQQKLVHHSGFIINLAPFFKKLDVYNIENQIVVFWKGSSFMYFIVYFFNIL